MRSLILSAFFAVIFSVSLGSAQTCPDLRIDGIWKTDEPSFFSHHWRTYKITQSGCYVLVFDTLRKATWKVDLSGGHKIRVPKEQVEANRNGGGPTAAQNMATLEVSLSPTYMNENFYEGMLTADPYLEEQKSFPVSMNAHFGVELSIVGPDKMCPPICNSSSGTIRLQLRDFQILDITKGLPGSFDKKSFLAGLNAFASMFVKAFSYKLSVLTLVKDQ